MALFERTSGTWAAFCHGAWEFGTVRGELLMIGGKQTVGPRAAAIASPVGGSVVDAEARVAIEAVLNALREHGLIES